MFYGLYKKLKYFLCALYAIFSFVSRSTYYYLLIYFRKKYLTCFLPLENKMAQPKAYYFGLFYVVPAAQVLAACLLLEQARCMLFPGKKEVV